jgi:hypothetical protein
MRSHQHPISMKSPFRFGVHQIPEPPRLACCRFCQTHTPGGGKWREWGGGGRPRTVQGKQISEQQEHIRGGRDRCHSKIAVTRKMIIKWGRVGWGSRDPRKRQLCDYEGEQLARKTFQQSPGRLVVANFRDRQGWEGWGLAALQSESGHLMLIRR